MIYITGDTHGDFERIAHFCKKQQTSKSDIMIVLGDAGINSDSSYWDISTKKQLKEMPITLFCIHGNHEKRPFDIPAYRLIEWNGGLVYAEDEYPNILFAKDGEVFDFDGQRTIVIGGAYSVDKYYRLQYGYPWWPNEQPSEQIKKEVEERLERSKWRVDVVLSHTCPYIYRPIDMFLQGIDQGRVDDSTERWLGDIESKLQYDKWYCGHFHINRKVDKLRFMFEDILIFEGGDAGVKRLSEMMSTSG